MPLKVFKIIFIDSISSNLSKHLSIIKLETNFVLKFFAQTFDKYLNYILIALN
jgi:hypothetical protein